MIDPREDYHGIDCAASYVIRSKMRVLLRPPGHEPYTMTLDRLTAHVRAARVLRMGRLADKLAKASDALHGIEDAVDRDVDALIERTKLVHKRREDAFMKKHADLDRHMGDIAEFEKEIAEFDGKNDFSGGGGHSEGDAYAGTSPSVKP